MGTPETSIKSIEIFFSYAKKDSQLRDKLADHLSNLKRRQVITAWHDNEISAGTERVTAIEEHLNSADIILLLISADFMASEELWERDVKRAMARHDQKEARVIPVLLRNCDWQGAPFSHLQPLPRDGRAIKTWSDEDTAFTEVVQDIRKAIEQMTGRSQEVEEVISQPLIDKELKKTKKSWRDLIPLTGLRSLFGASVGVTTVIVLMRFFGLIQVSELWLYDAMMRSQSDEPTDERLLLVQITPQDSAKYGAGEGTSLSEKTTSALLKKLQAMNPRVIGLDLYRESNAKDPKLIEILTNESRLIAICKVADPYANSVGTLPPPEVKRERVGFSDFLPDEDNIIRRQVLQISTKDFKSGCRATNSEKVMDSFAFNVAQKYLETEGKEFKYKSNNTGNLISGSVTLQHLYGLTTGGYQNTDMNGYQVLLNYRSVCRSEQSTLPRCSPQKIATTTTVQEIIENKIDKSEVENKIILIGTRIEGIDPPIPTPFKESAMPGMILHAQIVSQIVSAVLDARPLITVWPIWYEIIWIFSWSLSGGILALLCPSKRLLIISGGTTFASLYIICLVSFISPMKLWIPFVPAAATFVCTGGIVVLKRLQTKPNVNNLP